MRTKRFNTPEKPKTKHRGKDCQKATDSKVYACSDADLSEVLFNFIMSCDKQNRDLLGKIYHVSTDGISKDLSDH